MIPSFAGPGKPPLWGQSGSSNQQKQGASMGSPNPSAAGHLTLPDGVRIIPVSW
jgi:hypothetical protein